MLKEIIDEYNKLRSNYNVMQDEIKNTIMELKEELTSFTKSLEDNEENVDMDFNNKFN
jgi:hypothetical protein